MSSSFEERLAALADRLELGHGGLADGHARWAVYAEALGRAEVWPELLALVGHEPDQPLAAALVVRALEVLPADRRGAFVAVLPEGRSREYAATRARELAILEALAAGEDPEFDAPHWSNWLQLRAATTIDVRETLEALNANGATKRIRNAAGLRLRIVRGTDA